MPGLFSRRPKAKVPTLLNSTKGYLGAVSSADIDRLGLSSPTPSTADAHLLPNVPTKDDLPTPPPKEPAGSSSFHAPPHLDSYISRQTSNSSRPPLQPLPATMNEFGQMQTQAAPRPATIASYTQSADKQYLQSPSASTLIGARRPSPTLHSFSSKSHLGRQQSSSSSVYDASSASNPAAAPKSTYAYGYTIEGWHVQLEAARVSALLEACGEQIRNRGLDNPLIFSSMALDLSPANVASLIKLFTTSSAGQRSLPPAFLDEIRYANPHDLAAVIKWAFARMGRVLAVPVPVPGAKKGEVREEMVYVQQRGFLDLEAYNAWREQERRQQYPATAFKDFLAHLGHENSKLLGSLFSLLSSTASYSLKNGMMPTKLCKHFGPLLFGLPEDETFARTYDAYIRASNATEHLLLAYIRFQGTTAALPPRLAQHVNGYPSILQSEITLPSASSKLVPITQIERNVRLYSADLVQSACEVDLTESCPEWQDCRDTNEALGKDPQLSDKFRKLINLRGGAIQGRKPGAARARDVSTEEDDAVAAHSSLVSKRWDDFMSDGFSAPDSSKLAFDLNESARRKRIAKRETVQWNEFSKDGFQNGDSENLSDVLSFDDVLKQDVQNWPSERDQLHAKLKSRQEKLPAFNYDTTPRLLASPTLAGAPEGTLDNHPISRMDETFADVWADYLLGSGWSNRDELTHRNANFVVVQYKSRPNASTVGSQSAGSSLSAPTRFQVSARKEENVPKDERVDAAWFVIQEVVPAQYRADLEASGRGTSKGRAMIRKLTMFRSRKDKEKSNGNTYEKTTDSADDVFRPGPGGSTKRILLSDQLKRNGSKNGSRSSLRSHRTSLDKDRPGSAAAHARGEEDASEDHSNNGHVQFRSEGHQTGSKLMSTLRTKSIRVVKSARRGASSPALNSQVAPVDDFGMQSNKGRSRTQQGDMFVDRSFTSADFETRSVATDDASFAPNDDAVSVASSSGAPKRKPSQFKAREGAKRQQGGKDDSWIDIMVKANGNRMSGQDAPAASARSGQLGLPASRMDETAQLSVAEPDTGASTPRTHQLALSGSDETFPSGVPRSSTPPLTASAKGTPETDHADTLGLDRIDSRASDAGSEPDTTTRSDIPMRDASLHDATPASTPLKAASPLDPVAAARLALKSRKELPPRAPAQIDTKKLVESLRAGLSPIEAVRASKDVRAASPASPLNGSFSSLTSPPQSSSPAPAVPAGKPKGYRDPFAKDPVAGRVADVASRFGGRAAASGIPVAVVGKSEKPLPPVAASPTTPTPVAGGENGGTAAIGNALSRSSMESRDPDEIYPEDAVSNFDPRDRYQSSSSTDSPVGRHLELEDAGDMENLTHGESSYTWRKTGLAAAEGEDGYDGENEAPTRFAQPYQPGMPLDNVLEESESVVSGSTNL
ncbi:uncharacterized protein UTRI_02672 [Ustilago trichophora]|uniref:Meiotically up-regulated protein Msb1/Mug8 domain-containing protein n=1 Tax=Ustilago trichophora TaxID=86804 RepID=A0A5C3EPW7_9BASI|nr:uncharacterized protein UTRI_02672 [Ustilago trichophora]